MPVSSSVELAAQFLLEGKLVAIPTETVYGLAANAFDPRAVARVFSCKGRPNNHPLIVHIAPEWPLEQFAREIPDYVPTLIKTFWPGPLSLILHKRDSIDPCITGGQDSVAIRSPNHPTALALLRKFEKPLVAPSANPFGKVSPTTVEHVQLGLGNELLVLDGGRCTIGIESTIVDARHREGIRILRQGHISKDALAAWVPILNTVESDSPRASGLLKSHYQPRKPLFAFASPDDLNAFVAESQKTCFYIGFAAPRVLGVQLSQNPNQAAYAFYHALWEADASAADCLVLELPPDSIAWAALRERAVKAASAVFAQGSDYRKLQIQT